VARFALGSPATSWACFARARRAAGDSFQRQRFKTNAMWGSSTGGRWTKLPWRGVNPVRSSNDAPQPSPAGTSRARCDPVG
jgi:hypothetical protein